MTAQQAWNYKKEIQDGKTLKGRELTEDEIKEREDALNAYKSNASPRGRRSLSSGVRMANKKLKKVQETLKALPSDVVTSLTSVENTPNLSRKEQVMQDRLKVRVLNNRIYMNLKEMEQEKMVEKLSYLPEAEQARLTAKLERTLDMQLEREAKLKKAAEEKERKAAEEKERKAQAKVKAKAKAKANAKEAKGKEAKGKEAKTKGKEVKAKGKEVNAKGKEAKAKGKEAKVKAEAVKPTKRRWSTLETAEEAPAAEEETPAAETEGEDVD